MLNPEGPTAVIYLIAFTGSPKLRYWRTTFEPFISAASVLNRPLLKTQIARRRRNHEASHRAALGYEKIMKGLSVLQINMQQQTIQNENNFPFTFQIGLRYAY